MPTKSIDSLPNELLYMIYARTASTTTAIRLSHTSRRLRRVWLENAKALIDALLRPSIVAYDAAFNLMSEHAAVDGIEVDNAANAPLVADLLERNAELAMQAIFEFTPWVQRCRPDDVLGIDPALFFEAYYFIGRLVASHRNQNRRTCLVEEVRALPLAKLRVYYDLADFMINNHMLYLQQRRQGLLRDAEMDEMDADLDEHGNVKEEWNAAFDVLNEYLRAHSSQ